MNANNLFTFAKATPLVNISKHRRAEPVSDATRSDFDMRSKIMSALSDTKKEFKVKFDILTNQFLSDIAKNGSRLLHITSDVAFEDRLCVEGFYGISCEIPLRRLEQIFKNHQHFGLQVDVVGIALPQSVKVGRVFKNLQVKHVLCFDEANASQSVGKYDKEELASIVRFKFNFIYNFCVHFYKKLINCSSVIDAFRKAEKWVSKDQN